jgi:hypothetical protein
MLSSFGVSSGKSRDRLGDGLGLGRREGLDSLLTLALPLGHDRDCHEQ